MTTVGGEKGRLVLGFEVQEEEQDRGEKTITSQKSGMVCEYHAEGTRLRCALFATGAEAHTASRRKELIFPEWGSTYGRPVFAVNRKERFYVLNEDHSVQVFEDGALVWEREEGLASLEAVLIEKAGVDTALEKELENLSEKPVADEETGKNYWMDEFF